MKAITAKNVHDSFSFSRRYFNWKKKPEDEEDDMEEILNFSSSSRSEEDLPKPDELNFPMHAVSKRKKPLSRIKSALSLGKSKSHTSTKLVGTLFGYRRGHVHFSFQQDFKQSPVFMVEMATPTSVLVKEMACGLVRIALECDRRTEKIKGLKLIDEPIWRTYCNGRKCGYAMKRECGEEEWKILNAVGPISMGAGVLPEQGNGESQGEIMYMRAKFERVVGSKDSEAFYMMNPDGHGGPELSIYLLRV